MYNSQQEFLSSISLSYELGEYMSGRLAKKKKKKKKYPNMSKSELGKTNIPSRCLHRQKSMYCVLWVPELISSGM
jgi:hypothetical protein